MELSHNFNDDHPQESTNAHESSGATETDGEGGARKKRNRNFPTHDCSVNHDVDVVKLLMPADSVLKRFARWWRRRCLIDHRSPLAKLVFRSDTALKRELSRHVTYYPRTIHPFSYFRFIWECIMIVTFASAFLMIPYDVVFLFQQEDYYPFSPFHVVLLCTDGVCLLDVVVRFYSGTYKRRKQQVDLDLSRVRMQYLRLWFWIDIISSAPDPLMTRLIPPSTLDNSLLYCLHRLDFHPGCLWDFWSLMSVIKIFRFRTFLRYIRRLCQRMGLRRNVIQFTTILATVLTVFHWSACFLFLVMRLVQGPNLANVDQRSWTQQIPFWNQTAFVRYLECSYRTLYTVTHITHNFSESMTYDDMLMSLIFTVGGYILKIYLLAELLIFIRILFSSASKYHEYRYELSNYMRHEQLPAGLQKQILKFYDIRHPRVYSRWSLMRTLVGEQLFGEFRMEIMGSLIRACPLFAAVFSEHQLTAIALGMHFQIFTKNDIIVRWGAEHVDGGTSDKDNWNMVFIVSGTVAIYTSRWKEVLHLEDGEHFGEFQLLFDEDMVKFPNLVAVENCELYMLSRGWFDAFLKSYPVQRRKLIDLATEQLQQMKQMRRTTVLETLANVETVQMHSSRSDGAP
ncbi:potassium/sodium hyperpolarization-activated cyclic nucleotide-gated channel 1-like [Anopheles nili]|uniref:potassium/sodium hyperpolarization-activated cyclic nucleotide-gated channel 1-like n=1 Tax=Anopheles nili TaxID=185578 RepID=UPI00237A2AE5|nr:potassium/sodium hyperpolarization-activated cyclic nucleotide-gated channel 1-like [Anopheles nili]